MAVFCVSSSQCAAMVWSAVCGVILTYVLYDSVSTRLAPCTFIETEKSTSRCVRLAGLHLTILGHHGRIQRWGTRGPDPPGRSHGVTGFFCCGIQLYLLLSPYLCFISFLYLGLYVLGDDALIS